MRIREWLRKRIVLWLVDARFDDTGYTFVGDVGVVATREEWEKRRTLKSNAEITHDSLKQRLDDMAVSRDHYSEAKKEAEDALKTSRGMCDELRKSEIKLEGRVDKLTDSHEFEKARVVDLQSHVATALGERDALRDAIGILYGQAKTLTGTDTPA